MESDTPQKEKIHIVSLLKDSLQLYKDNFGLFFLILLMGNAVTLGEHFLILVNISLGVVGSIIFILGFFLMYWSGIAIILAVSRRSLNSPIGIKQSFGETKNKIGRYIVVSILGSWIFVAGLLLFVIPGLYWGTIFALTGIVVVLENTTIFEAFKRSKNLIEGHFWSIFGIYFLLFIASIPGWLIYRIDMSMNVKYMFINLYSIVSAPFFVAVNVNIYNRLKKIKGESKPPETGEIKKGAGCLGIIGLSIGIVFLGNIWFTVLNNFVRSGPGNKVYEWGAKYVSPKIKLHDGLVLVRPEGYLAVADQQESVYDFYGFVDKKFFSFAISFVSFDDLGITNVSSIKLGEGAVWDKYIEYLDRQSSYHPLTYSNMERESLQIINMGDRPWAEHILKEKENEYTKTRTLKVFDYSLSDHGVIFVSYEYDSGQELESPDARINEMRKILAGFKF